LTPAAPTAKKPSAIVVAVSRGFPSLQSHGASTVAVLKKPGKECGRRYYCGISNLVSIQSKTPPENSFPPSILWVVLDTRF